MGVMILSFRDLQLLKQYRTYRNDIVKEFYTPVLQQAVLYKRAVGFFSSTALIDLTHGISGMINNKGKIRFIVSPYLTQEDIEAIKRGYEQRKIIEKAMLRGFTEPQNYFQEERLNWLAYLIEEGYLEIKVAFTPINKQMGMYHEKMGIVKDADENKIAFTGSLNETINAFHNNYESIVVFNSWKESKEYAKELEDDFDELWNNQEPDLEIIEFPQVLKDKFHVRRKEKLELDIDMEENSYLNFKKDTPHIPDGFSFREYQLEAINNWLKNNGRGIFDMATGTGKTYTGLGAAVKLYEKTHKLAIIIVCPYQHLVEQWAEDIEFFNMKPIIGYSTSKQKKWREKLQNDVLDFSLGVIDSFCFVTTNATFATNYVSSIMSKLGKDTLLIVDEAHNFGATNLREKLNDKIEYRLALSATLERYGDPEGTQCLQDYFGDKCIEYDLERAIREKKLTPYYYYPEVVYLTNDEVEKYKDLSYQISRECHRDKFGKINITEKGKRLLIKRSRLVAGAENKLNKLRELMQDYKDKTHILVYCGATRVVDPNNDEQQLDEEGERQIVAVSKILGNEFGMKITHFTSNETSVERELIIRQFAAADPYQAIVAIKCLDEGVNIPSIKTAFILASTTNPKEYIQRRGRVLRLAKDKPYAVIFDFVTLVCPLDEVDINSSNYNYERSLACKELQRIKEFGSISLNQRDSNQLIVDIEDTFNLTETDLEDAYNGNKI